MPPPSRWRRAAVGRGAFIALLCAWLLGVAPPQQSPGDPDVLAQQAFRLLNEARVQAGLQPLRFDENLALIAQHHSLEQANRGRVSHHSSEYGLSTERRVRVSFPRIPRFAENVARNRTVERLNAALLTSEGHRRNRMDPEFTDVGVGIAWDGGYGLYLTEVFATSPDGGRLPRPPVFYFDAAPGSYERRENPRVEEAGQTIVIGPPGPTDPEYWTDAGINAYRDGRLDAAEESFRKALELKPDYHYASFNLARVLIARGQPDEAARRLDELIESDPEDFDAISSRGSAALLLEDYARAAQLFRRVLRVRPQDSALWYNLGLSLEYLERPTEAEIAYREALRIEPTLNAAQVGLARVRRH